MFGEGLGLILGLGLTDGEGDGAIVGIGEITTVVLISPKVVGLGKAVDLGLCDIERIFRKDTKLKNIKKTITILKT